MNDLIEMMRERKTPGEIVAATSLNPTQVWNAAEKHCPEWAQWVYAGVARDYPLMVRAALVRKWGIGMHKFYRICHAMGVEAKPGAKPSGTDTPDVPHPLMTRAISMKWSAA